LGGHRRGNFYGIVSRKHIEGSLHRGVTEIGRGCRAGGKKREDKLAEKGPSKKKSRQQSNPGGGAAKKGGGGGEADEKVTPVQYRQAKSTKTAPHQGYSADERKG